MTPTYIEKHKTEEGWEYEYRLGWASWDQNFTERSAKYVYRNDNGHISRGCPEIPIGVLFNLSILALQKGESVEHAKLKELEAALSAYICDMEADGVV